MARTPLILLLILLLAGCAQNTTPHLQDQIENLSHQVQMLERRLDAQETSSLKTTLSTLEENMSHMQVQIRNVQDTLITLHLNGVIRGPLDNVTFTPRSVTGEAIAPATIRAEHVDTSEIQRRIQACPPGKMIERVDEDGSVICTRQDLASILQAGDDAEQQSIRNVQRLESTEICLNASCRTTWPREVKRLTHHEVTCISSGTQGKTCYIPSGYAYCALSHVDGACRVYEYEGRWYVHAKGDSTCRAECLSLVFE